MQNFSTIKTYINKRQYTIIVMGDLLMYRVCVDNIRQSKAPGAPSILASSRARSGLLTSEMRSDGMFPLLSATFLSAPLTSMNLTGLVDST